MPTASAPIGATRSNAPRTPPSRPASRSWLPGDNASSTQRAIPMPPSVSAPCRANPSPAISGAPPIPSTGLRSAPRQSAARRPGPRTQRNAALRCPRPAPTKPRPKPAAHRTDAGSTAQPDGLAASARPRVNLPGPTAMASRIGNAPTAARLRWTAMRESPSQPPGTTHHRATARQTR
ncbi:hypothetical protein FQZ97_961890 [compost metagenome]